MKENRNQQHISEMVFGTQSGYQFRQSGHVFQDERFLGHIAYIKDARVLSAWSQLLAQ